MLTLCRARYTDVLHAHTPCDSLAGGRPLWAECGACGGDGQTVRGRRGTRVPRAAGVHVRDGYGREARHRKGVCVGVRVYVCVVLFWRLSW